MSERTERPKASALLAPVIEKVDVLAAKLP